MIYHMDIGLYRWIIFWIYDGRFTSNHLYPGIESLVLKCLESALEGGDRITGEDAGDLMFENIEDHL